MTLAEARDSLAWTSRVSVLRGATTNRWLGVWGGMEAFRVSGFGEEMQSSSGGLGVGLNMRAYLSGLYVRTATFRFPDDRVAAARGLEKPDHRPKPADPKVSRAQPP